MEVIEILREFSASVAGAEITLPDPNPAFTVGEVMQFYSGKYPELTTANWTGPEIINDKRVYTFSTILGNKG